MLTEQFTRLVGITKRLRKECPWDREQTHASIRQSLIEEAYEVVESIDHAAWGPLRDELGDILLHVLFHANIAEEQGEFTLGDVIEAISAKLIRRHPHVYGTAGAAADGAPEGGTAAAPAPADAAEVQGAWERLKLREGRASLLDGVPAELPALLRAARITQKASAAGFDWKTKEEVWKKVGEETGELLEAASGGDPARIEEEYGDLLFALVNYGRFIGANPEIALRGTIRRFTERFGYIERRLREAGKEVHGTPLEELDRYWNEAKRTGGVPPA